jgi:hypothetical protein
MRIYRYCLIENFGDCRLLDEIPTGQDGNLHCRDVIPAQPEALYLHDKCLVTCRIMLSAGATKISKILCG